LFGSNSTNDYHTWKDLAVNATYDTLCRVHTDRGKVWKVLEFNVEIFEALKSLENDQRYGKVGKNP